MPTRSADYSTSQQTPATADTPGEPPAQADGAKEHLLTVTNMIITMAMLTGAGRVASC